MSNLTDALDILLNEDEPEIYDYETNSEFTFIAIDYNGGAHFAVPIEMLIDESSDTMLSLVGQPENALNINKQTAKNNLWAELLVNEINKNLSTESQQIGVWSCSLEGDSIEDALQLSGKLTFQFVVNIPKLLDTQCIAELIKLGVESYKKSVGRIQRFIRKCEGSKSALEFDDVFPDKKIKISFHPRFVEILKNLTDDE